MRVLFEENTSRPGHSSRLTQQTSIVSVPWNYVDGFVRIHSRITTILEPVHPTTCYPINSRRWRALSPHLTSHLRARPIRTLPLCTSCRCTKAKRAVTTRPSCDAQLRPLWESWYGSIPSDMPHHCEANSSGLPSIWDYGDTRVQSDDKELCSDVSYLS